ncbi:ABC transporter permease [Rhodococcus sp. NM-2]|jgi:ABC-2 type transport system permease protein|uniref:Multidrug ABC transporter permease n=2 Tax=Rhodococcus TaxID=1827 RepID=A0A2S8J3I9_RHOOP|nr:MULTISPECIES: ABC transporter permease [Rhodococcus]MDI9974551.1 ABC transporter permease [Rhodococcus sp. IEGM 1307]MDV6279081.1 ABC transporter permease [Rhodococcus jostii]PQP21631.1 multidrug ABC transporter permease [Rhodococcus opacus]
MTMSTSDRLTENRFAPGTFAPDPRPSGAAVMLRAQTALELKLLLRNGEQLLLTMFIPITLLIGLCLLPIGDLGTSRVDKVVPAVMMVAVMSTAFTGQAIAVGFDRRYGALKRLGATPLPTWGIIAGKSAAVVIVVALQSVLLGSIGLALGWRPSAWGLVLGAVIIALGTVTFAAMGLLLGGTLRADIVLALANILWFVMVGVGSVVFATGELPWLLHTGARLIPSGALAHALDAALSGSVDLLSVVVLVVWGAAAGALAARTFRFT